MRAGRYKHAGASLLLPSGLILIAGGFAIYFGRAGPSCGQTIWTGTSYDGPLICHDLGANVIVREAADVWARHARLITQHVGDGPELGFESPCTDQGSALALHALTACDLCVAGAWGFKR